MLLVNNFKGKVKKLEEWSKQTERERCRIILEKVKQEETRGKSRRGREKNQRYEALKEKTERDKADIKVKQQMAKIEDTIQMFLTPDPVKRHKPRTRSNKTSSLASGAIEESKEEGVDIMGEKVMLVKANVYTGENVRTCERDENIIRRIDTGDVISYMESSLEYSSSKMLQTALLTDFKSN
eukprot:TRINITY_DN12090_c0_g2_i6.p2 TRINITY_DN12090_c0_g2~~TRINITY_DN12090_c0_g2_i6.p2  ORF type:complete len:182 (-),score=71.43 TRINITY_DN12090_c0_g2_i6:44-589(-)